MGGKIRRPSSAKMLLAFCWSQYFVRRRIKISQSVTNSESGHNISRALAHSVRNTLRVRRSMLKKRIFALALFRSHAALCRILDRCPHSGTISCEHGSGRDIPLKEIKSHIETVVPDRYGKVGCNLATVGHGKTKCCFDMGYTHAMNMGGISRLDMPKVKNR